MISPLLITLTGEPDELAGRKRKPIFSSKGKRRLKTAGKIGAWIMAPSAMATFYAAKKIKAASKRKAAAKKAQAARKREDDLKRKKAAATAAAAANPTPETAAAAHTATIQAAAATANAQAAEREETAATTPETNEQLDEEQNAESAAEEEADDQETSGDYFGIVTKTTARPAIPAPQVLTRKPGPAEWIKNNKAQAGILAAALAIGFYYTAKKKK